MNGDRRASIYIYMCGRLSSSLAKHLPKGRDKTWWIYRLVIELSVGPILHEKCEEYLFRFANSFVERGSRVLAGLSMINGGGIFICIWYARFVFQCCGICKIF